MRGSCGPRPFEGLRRDGEASLASAAVGRAGAHPFLSALDFFRPLPDTMSGVRGPCTASCSKLSRVFWMFRIAVATYLMAVTLAGPWLCCCTTTRLAALLPAPPPGERPSSSPPRGCCGHHPTSGDQGRAPGKAPERSKHPGGPGCPCQHDLSRTALPFAPESDSVKYLAQRHPSLDVPAFLPLLKADPGLLCGGCSLTPPDGPALPFLTTEDLLDVLHILRC